MEEDEAEIDMDLDPSSPARLLPPSSTSTTSSSLVVAADTTTPSVPTDASSSPAPKSQHSRQDSGYDSSTPLSLSTLPSTPKSTPPPPPPPTPELDEPRPTTSSTSNPLPAQPFVLKPPAIRPSLPTSSTRPLRPSPLSQGQESSTPSHSNASISSPLHHSTPLKHVIKPKVPSRLAELAHTSSPSRMTTPVRRPTSPRRFLPSSSSRNLQSSTPQRHLIGQLDPTSQSPFKSTEPPINASPIQLQSLADEVFEQFRLLEEEQDESEDVDLEESSSSDVEDEDSLCLGDEEQEEGEERKEVVAPPVAAGFGFRTIVVHPMLAARSQGAVARSRMLEFVDTPTGTPVKEGKPTERGIVLDAVVAAAKRVAERIQLKPVGIEDVEDVVLEADEEVREMPLKEGGGGKATIEEELVVVVASRSPSPSTPPFSPLPLPQPKLPHPLPSKPSFAIPTSSQHGLPISSHQPIASSSSSTASSSRPLPNPPPRTRPRSPSQSQSPSRKSNFDEGSYWSHRRDTLESFRRVGSTSNGSSRERERERSPVRRPRPRSRSRSRSPERREPRRVDSYQQEVRRRADEARERERREVDDERRREDRNRRGYERERERDYRGGYEDWIERRGGGGDGRERRRR
ncbi:hypothetical protein BDY24DRAFT_376559 [Mrakia frigida]|uniref:uncharacterized protein n=1 Tax=Mrakia frigida TaxID=29902 RepID=UPI003FCC090F